jgi:hypothetical protein
MKDPAKEQFEKPGSANNKLKEQISRRCLTKGFKPPVIDTKLLKVLFPVLLTFLLAIKPFSTWFALQSKRKSELHSFSEFDISSAIISAQYSKQISFSISSTSSSPPHARLD